MRNKKLSQKFFLRLISLASLFVLMAAIFFAGGFNWLENKAYDKKIVLSANSFPVSDDISLVLLDQDSLDWAKEKLGWSWPWPRESYGKIVDFFNQGKAASLAFDMIYSEPSLYGPEDDEKFAQSSKKFGRVIQTVFYESNSSDKKTLPIPQLQESAAYLGNVTSNLDSDLVARRNRVQPLENRPELGLSLASLYVKNQKVNLEEIPLAKKGGMYVRYVDSLSRFYPYSAREILQSQFKIEELKTQNLSEEDFNKKLEELSRSDRYFINPLQFKDNFVFFGLYAPGLFDICATPVSATYPGVGVHLCQLDTILQKKFLRDSPLILNILLILAGVFGGFFLGISIHQAKTSSLLIKTSFALLVCFACSLANYGIFAGGMILPFFPPLLTFILSFITAIFENYMTEGRQKIYLKTAFRQYLSPAVIENLIENPEKLNLGGEEREITAYFSDVQGFTSISESLTPKELTDLLNTYLSAMTDIILKHGGTIDKYEGDAIIAFWGAPTRQDDHAKRAVDAALECQEKLSQMQEELQAVCGKPFVQRIGLNTGKAVVGNMGSRSRFDYTMMGDTVNLASRLEGINKQFGTYTMCSRATMDSAIANGSEYAFRPISKIAVVGKKTGVDVFVPMSKDKFEETASVRSIYDQAYSLFVEGSFAKAKEIFSSNGAFDPPSEKFVSKCDKLIQNPPENWDGILRATEK